MRVTSPWAALARASTVGGVALLMMACGSDSTNPGGSGITPDQLSVIGDGIATEVEGSASLMTVFEVTHPSEAVRRVRDAVPGAPLLSLARVLGTAAPSSCPTFSPASPADGDHDGVPDQATLTFALPDCQATDPSGDILKITGTIALSDPAPSDSSVASNGTATDFTIDFASSQGVELLNTSRGGVWATTPAGTGLSQNYQMHSTVSVSGVPALDITTGWTSVFTPQAGSTVFMGAELPLGSLSVTGPITVNDGLDAFTMTMETTVPLQYDAQGCASKTTSFTGGEAHAALSGGTSGYVKVVWANCDLPTYTYVPQ
ncbi:MAG: hypothetical protein ACREOJ_18010 [Gemmatimonadaceae bacterium]